MLRLSECERLISIVLCVALSRSVALPLVRLIFNLRYVALTICFLALNTISEHRCVCVCGVHWCSCCELRNTELRRILYTPLFTRQIGLQGFRWTSRTSYKYSYVRALAHNVCLLRLLHVELWNGRCCFRVFERRAHNSIIELAIRLTRGALLSPDCARSHFAQRVSARTPPHCVGGARCC